MSVSYELFLQWKTLKNFASDRAAALELVGSASTVDNWKRRGSNGEAHVIERMCKDLGVDPIPYIMRCFEEAAKGDAKRALSRILKSYSKHGVVFFGCVFALGMQPEAQGSSGEPLSRRDAAGLYIMRSHWYPYQAICQDLKSP